MSPEAAVGRVLVIACGALARELSDIIERNDLPEIVVECLPAHLHNTPSRIPAAVEKRIERARPHYSRIFVGYADCGTGGMLDRVLERHDVERLPGAHCYEFFSGRSRFADLHESELGTLYLTDYLARHFDRLVWKGLGLDRHPQLLDDYFKHYRRVLYISQSPTEELMATARRVSERLGLDFEHIHVGYGEAEPELVSLVPTLAAGSGW